MYGGAFVLTGSSCVRAHKLLVRAHHTCAKLHRGQGRTEDECLDSLRQAILLLMEDRREDARHRLKDEATLLELA